MLKNISLNWHRLMDPKVLFKIIEKIQMKKTQGKSVNYKWNIDILIVHCNFHGGDTLRFHYWMSIKTQHLHKERNWWLQQAHIFFCERSEAGLVVRFSELWKCYGIPFFCLYFWHDVSLTEIMSNKQIMGYIRRNFRVYMKFEQLFVLNTEIFHLNSRAIPVSWTL